MLPFQNLYHNFSPALTQNYTARPQYANGNIYGIKFKHHSNPQTQISKKRILNLCSKGLESCLHSHFLRNSWSCRKCEVIDNSFVHFFDYFHEVEKIQPEGSLFCESLLLNYNHKTSFELENRKFFVYQVCKIARLWHTLILSLRSTIKI